ncbi:MAG: sugar phosphate isomerase/epimerase [Acidisphaera sp.]|nr:sugar phosphate isomerase/epimerase [Acidisphaera sp.]
MTRFSLAHLTVLGLPPPEVVRVAARTGYQHVGLRLIAVTPTSPGYPLMQDAAMMRATRAALSDTGLSVLDVEFVKLTPEIDVTALEPFVAAGAELGASYIITAPSDPDLARLADRLAAMTDLSARYGLRTVLEFFPWTVVADLGAAARVVEAAGRADTGILVDTLHFNRSGSTLDQLDRVPAWRLPFVHVCDAPVQDSYTTEELLHASRVERLPPGEGAIDIPGILAHLPPGIPVALEVPMAELTRTEGAETVARRVRQGAERVLSAAVPALREAGGDGRGSGESC